MKLLLLIILGFGFISPGFAQDEDEAVAEELEAEQRKQFKQIQKLNEQADLLKEGSAGIADQAEFLKKQTANLGEKALTLDDMMSDEFYKMLEEKLKNNPLRQMDKALLREMIIAKTSDHPAGKIFTAVPMTLEIAVDFLQDEKAIMGLLKLVKKKERLKVYGFIWLFLLLSFWWMKKNLIPQDLPFFQRFFQRTLLSLTGTIISTMTFYFMFKQEIQPTWMIIKNHLL